MNDTSVCWISSNMVCNLVISGTFSMAALQKQLQSNKKNVGLKGK